ncbi:MAG TPA: DUF4145 domain-containing protein [Gemmataceae bacterium]|nr:DUF4145 domain-containing protein [Gemmataceae bacterium]
MIHWLKSRAGSVAETPEALRSVRDELSNVADVAPLNHEVAAMQARRIVEQLVCEVHRAELGEPRSKPLFNMIESLREKGKLPARIVSYLHTIRRIGDDAAHGQDAGNAKITKITAEDLLAVLWPLVLVIEWYFCSFEKGPRCTTIYQIDPPHDMPVSQSEHADLIERLIALAEQSPRDFGLALWIEQAQASGPVRDFIADLEEPVARFHLEDRVAICARAEADCHLWIIDVGTTGRNAIVFPPNSAEDNRVTAGQVVRIEGTLSGKSGLETVHAFASTTRLSTAVSNRKVRDFLADVDSTLNAVARPGCAAAILQFGIADKPKVEG